MASRAQERERETMSDDSVSPFETTAAIVRAIASSKTSSMRCPAFFAWQVAEIMLQMSCQYSSRTLRCSGVRTPVFRFVAVGIVSLPDLNRRLFGSESCHRLAGRVLGGPVVVDDGGTADNNVAEGRKTAVILVILTVSGKNKRRAELRDWSVESATCVCGCVFRVRAGV